jgi:SAM-dependent methyltransferase
MMLGRVKRFAYDRLQVYLQRAFDFFMGGVDTVGLSRTSVDAYSTGSDNWPYQGCYWPALLFTLKRLGHADTFIDLGCGKGRALLIAARLPYRRVIGVEIDEDWLRRPGATSI